MNRRRHLHRNGMPALDLLDDALRTLRAAPPSITALHAVGSIPFILGLLYFWADMSAGALAAEHCAGAALGLALLFFWMKVWQAAFAIRLREAVGESEPTPWTWRRIVRLALSQCLVQPLAIVAVPLALLLTIPGAWVVAFFPNFALTGDGQTGTRAAADRAWRLAAIWPKQNHFLLFFLFLLAAVVFLNLGVTLLALPVLLKTLTGWESVFTLNVWSLLNTTFLAVCAGLAYLILDPVLKTAYVLRCFHGDSLTTAEDLLAVLKHRRNGAGLALAAAFLFLTAAATPPARAAPAPASAAPAQAAAPASVRADELDRAIRNVLEQPEFNWRLPRKWDLDGVKPPGMFESFGKWLETKFENATGWLKRKAQSVLRFFRKFFPAAKPREEGVAAAGDGRQPWGAVTQVLLGVLIFIAAAVLGVLLWRLWRQRRKPGAVAPLPAAAPATPDLTKEQVSADELPADGWVELAERLATAGEWRLALRAWYLSGLARLARQELIRLARHKSNRDYLREVRGRASHQPELPEIFAEAVRLFDGTWYGRRQATSDLLQQMRRDVERMDARG